MWSAVAFGRIQSHVGRPGMGAERDGSVDRIQPAIVGRGCQGLLFLFGAGFPGQTRDVMATPEAYCRGQSERGVFHAGARFDQRFGDGQRVLVRRPFRLLLQAEEGHAQWSPAAAPLGLERRAAFDEQLRHGPAAMRHCRVERCFAGNPVGLNARHRRVKSKIQHQPHGCRVSRPREIGEQARVLGLHTSHQRWVRHGELARLG